MRKTLAFSAAVLLLDILMAHAADLPRLREGLWEIRGESIENPGNKKTVFTYRLCRNHAYDKAMDALVKNMKGCTTRFDDLGSGRYASASQCTVDGIVIVSKGTYSYQSETSTRTESSATYTPPLRGKTDESVIQDQSYVGDCPAGMKPGDRIMVDGTLRPYGK
jgi:hypothetical protein